MTWLKLILIVAAISLIIGAITAMINGYLDYKERDKAPKEEMYWCTKHGAFPRKYCLPLFPHLTTGDGKRPANAFVCPTCYKEAVFDAPDQRLKHG